MNISSILGVYIIGVAFLALFAIYTISTFLRYRFKNDRTITIIFVYIITSVITIAGTIGMLQATTRATAGQPTAVFN